MTARIGIVGVAPAKLRVAQVVDRLKRPGGAEALLLTLAAAAPRVGLQVTLVTLQENDPAMCREVMAHGAQVVAFPARRLGDPLRLARLMRFIRRASFDLVHTHLGGATIIGAIAARACGVPVVTTLHSPVRSKGNHRYHARVEDWLLRHCVGEIVAAGHETRAAHAGRLGRADLTVLSSAVLAGLDLTPAERRAVRTGLVGDPDLRLLISIGRLVEQKGVLDLLEAFGRLCRERDDVRLLIAGDGPLADEVGRRLGRLGLADRARLLGVRDDVPQLLAASDAYVSASLWEGSPVAVLEAMAAARPVVATAVGDLPDILGSGAGILVPPAEPEALARALGSLLADPARCRTLGGAARARAEARFGADAWASELVRIYRRALDSQRRRRRASDRGPAPRGADLEDLA